MWVGCSCGVEGREVVKALRMVEDLVDLFGVVLSALSEAAVVAGEEDATAHIDEDRGLTSLVGKGSEVTALGTETRQE